MGRLGHLGGSAPRLKRVSGFTGGESQGAIAAAVEAAQEGLAPTVEGQPADSFQVQEGLRALSHNLVFSSSDQDTVAWATGSIVLSDGTTYTIDAGNTGNMSALTYIYLDVEASTTVLQTTTTVATATGSRKLLLAIAQNSSDSDDIATFLVFGGSGGWGGTWTLPENIRKFQVRCTHSADATIADDTLTALSWDTETFDTDGMHFPSAAALTGTVAKTATSATLVGTDTLFTTELSVGQVIVVPGTADEIRVVTAIASNTSLTVNTAYANTATGQTATRKSSAIVFRTAGRYAVCTWVNFAVNAMGFRHAQVLLNNDTTIARGACPAAASADTDFTLTMMQEFAANDYVEVKVRQNSGGNLSVQHTAGMAFMAFRVY